MQNPHLRQLASEWLVEATLDDLQAAMEKGTVTSQDLVLMYQSRIAAFDRNGPALNSVLELNPDALHLAQALDQERALKGPRGPLHGIPVLIKDNIDTADMMHTSAGSIALADHYASEDSFIAKKLREAGAVILGKTNMTEWANFLAFDMPSGYSSRGGQVLNPYGAFTTGGSSSGSGVSVAANLCAVAVGTETSGSIISPSTENSVVGIKPTVGLVSRAGIIPIAFSQDTAGPIARTVRDAAILLGVLAGVDEKDAVTAASVGRAHADYTQFLDANALKGARIGVARGEYVTFMEEEQQAKLEEALEILRAQGAEVVDIELPEYWESEVLFAEFKPALNAYLKTVGPNVPVRNLGDVIAFNKAHEEKALKYGQGVFEKSDEYNGTLTEPAYIEAREQDLYLSKTAGIDKAMREHNLDAWVYGGYMGSFIGARAGYPSVSVPMGATSNGRPIGLAFSGLAYSEPKLIALAYAFEQATHLRVKPQL